MQIFNAKQTGICLWSLYSSYYKKRFLIIYINKKINRKKIGEHRARNKSRWIIDDALDFLDPLEDSAIHILLSKYLYINFKYKNNGKYPVKHANNPVYLRFFHHEASPPNVSGFHVAILMTLECFCFPLCQKSFYNSMHVGGTFNDQPQHPQSQKGGWGGIVYIAVFVERY